jgi:hypothetical protein
MKRQNYLKGYITKTLVTPLALVAALGTSPAVNAALGTDPSPVDPKLQSAQQALLNTLDTLTPGTPQFTAVAKALENLSTPTEMAKKAAEEAVTHLKASE